MMIREELLELILNEEHDTLTAEFWHEDTDFYAGIRLESRLRDIEDYLDLLFVAIADEQALAGYADYHMI